MTDLAALRSAVRLMQSGRADEAVRQLESVLDGKPDDVDALALIGLAHAHRGDDATAAAYMARALALNPRHAATQFNHGNVLGRLGRWADAADAFARALELKPDHAGARRARGHALAELKRDADALSELNRIEPDDVATLTLRAKLRFEAEQRLDALADYDRIVGLDPANWKAWNNRGIVLDKLERYEAALVSYERALAIEPHDDSVLHNRGAALICLQRYDEALPLFERLIASDPDRADNWSCHGLALASLLRPEDALASFDEALARDPNSHRARNGRGMALVALGRVDEGIAEYKAALAAEPDDATARVNLAFAELVCGNLADGLANYEWRRRTGPIAKGAPRYPQGEWQGENLAGKTLLLYPEQGFGDVVQFARFAPVLAARGARVIVEVPPALEALLRTLRGVTIVRTGERAPRFDLHAPLMSVAHRLGVTLDAIPAESPYLRADEGKRALWRERLSALPAGPRVGLCWSGHHIHRSDNARSIPLAALAPLLDTPGIAFVSLQRDVREIDAPTLKAHTRVADWANQLRDFSDTAALIGELDLVVTVDTAVAHVAGALAKPVWILLAAAPDWRWLLARDDSPWYATARLLRQPKLGDWSSVIARVQDALATLS